VPIVVDSFLIRVGCLGDTGWEIISKRERVNCRDILTERELIADIPNLREKVAFRRKFLL
jgi:hypothetical protein